MVAAYPSAAKRALPAPRTGVLTPFEPGTRTLEAGFQIAPQFTPMPVDVVFDKDVAMQLRDGTTIHVDVSRPVGTEPVPVIVAWSPYGKAQGTSASVMGVFGLVGLPNSVVSGLEKFEAPDPAYWVAHGYAICNVDVRGVVDSEGDSVLWDRQEGRDAHDVIEWLAEQDWCDGKVGMSGTSYLAVSQWFTAAEQPPHLVAINPWEGVSDVYRDLVMRGGMPDTGFAQQLQEGSFFGRNRKEDILSEVEAYPLMSDLWEQKIPDFERITVPAYVVASYSNTLHTAGTFRAWRRMASTEKWLRIHNGQEWPDYYNEANVEDLRRFFDHYLRGIDNGWEATPRVRYSILDLEGGDEVGVAAEGSDGRLRVSARHLDEALSTEDVPAHTFDRVEKLAPGEIAEIEIDLFPVGLRFHAGEQLRFVVSSRNLLGTLMPAIREYVGANTGTHVIHTGGEHASYLQLPVRG